MLHHVNVQGQKTIIFVVYLMFMGELLARLSFNWRKHFTKVARRIRAERA